MTLVEIQLCAVLGLMALNLALSIYQSRQCNCERCMKKRHH